MKKIIVILITLFVAYNLPAQTKISELKPSEYFDFWLGQWTLSWQSTDSTIGKGENYILKTLNDQVIQENFRVTNDPNMKNFEGKSWSVYNKSNKTWYQTWVDNQGAYLDFVGEVDGEKRIFKRVSKQSADNSIQQRMVFYNIQQDSFTWDWENSSDHGKTWVLRWRIEYKRKNN